MSTCLICYSSISNHPTLSSCACTFCSDCLYSWLSLKVRDFSYKYGEKIKCPNEFCNTQYLIESNVFLRNCLTKTQEDLLENLIFQKYLKNTSDIIACPHASCDYSGFANPDKSCKDNYYCELCGNAWQEQVFMPDKIIEKVNRIITGRMINDILSYIYQELFTENCPECLIAISRNGGCHHMTCKNCNYQFCWYCKQKYLGHQLNICMIHMILKLFLMMVLIFLVLGKIGIFAIIWDCFVLFACYFVKYLIFYNIVLMMFLLYAIYVFQHFKLRNDPKRRKPGMELVFFGSISLMMLVFIIRKGYITECFFSWSLETVLITIGYNLVGVFTLMHNNWISFVE